MFVPLIQPDELVHKKSGSHRKEGCHKNRGDESSCSA